MTETIDAFGGEFRAVGALSISATAKYVGTIMLATGVTSAAEICAITGLPRSTVYRAQAEFYEHGGASLSCLTRPTSEIPTCPTDEKHDEKVVSLVPPVRQLSDDAPRAPASMTPRATKELPSEVVISKKDTPLPPQPKFPTDYDVLQAYQAFNEVAQRLGLPIAHKLTPDRTRRCRARLSEYGRDGWDRALRNLENSKFCTGKTDAGFRADFDFMLQAKSFGRLHDGGYSDKGASRPTASAVPASRVSYDAMVQAECERIANEMAGVQ